MVFIGFSDSVNGLHEKTSRKRKKSIASSTNFVGNLIWKLYGISKVKRSFHPKFRTSIRFNHFFSLYVLFFCSQQSDSSIQIKLNPLDFRHTLTVNYFNYFLYTNLEQNTYIKPNLLAAQNLQSSNCSIANDYNLTEIHVVFEKLLLLRSQSQEDETKHKKIIVNRLLDEANQNFCEHSKHFIHRVI